MAISLNVEMLVESAAAMGASDIHLTCGLPPKVRIDGELRDLCGDILTAEDCEKLAKSLAGEQKNEIGETGEWDLARTIAGERVRINLYRSRGALAAAIRILSSHIPGIETLGLPEAAMQFPCYNKGIVLITGETGSGKSTTLAAILDAINHTRREHIITLEDPIEYVYEPDLCLINQREIGKDTESYPDGLRAILREDPDIILIGEMRDNVTIETALVAAETGHLVFATLHTNSAVDSVDRLVGVFPAERQSEIRMQLSTALRAVVSQQLLPKASGKGRVLASEIMIVTPGIRNLIREGKTPQMQNALQTSAKDGCVTMDHCLIDLASRGLIKPDTALEAGNDQELIRRKMIF